jgi:hypothetical protein
LNFQEEIQPFSEGPLTPQVLLSVLRDYRRPFDKINELTRQGYLLPIKRGLYIPGPKLRLSRPDPFLLANHLYGPSYVSLDSALAYWGMIPERVMETVSITTKFAKKYETAAGRFTYIHMLPPYYAFGIQQVTLTERQQVLIASPEKALCDKIITTSGILLRSKKQTMDLLLEDLRISETALKELRFDLIEEWSVKAPKQSSMEMLAKSLRSIK